MNLSEYAEALFSLPENYKALPLREVVVTEYRNSLIIAHSGVPHIMFMNGEWLVLAPAEVQA